MENAKVAQAKVDQRHPGTNYMIPQGISVRLDAKKKKLDLQAKLELGIKVFETAVGLYSQMLQIVEVILKGYVLTHSHAFARHSRCQVRPTCNNRNT